MADAMARRYRVSPHVFLHLAPLEMAFVYACFRATYSDRQRQASKVAKGGVMGTIALDEV